METVGCETTETRSRRALPTRDPSRDHLPATHRRVGPRPARLGNVAEACRVFGISRTSYYEWKNVADRYGLDGLDAQGAPGAPDARGHPDPRHRGPLDPGRAPSRPSAVASTPTDSVTRGFSIAKSTVQKHLVAHGLGQRAQRLAKAAAIAAATTGLVVPDAASKDEPFGFCLASGGPGELVCLDSFYIGKLKGVGKVYQLTAIDVFTRFAVRRHRARHAQRRHDAPVSSTRRCVSIAVTGCSVRAMLSDNGPEYIAGTFIERPGGQGAAPRTASRPARQTTTPSASASRAPCSKSAGDRPFTAVTSPRSANSRPKRTRGCITYNHRRRNHGDYMRGRTPHEILDRHAPKRSSVHRTFGSASDHLAPLPTSRTQTVAQNRRTGSGRSY